MTSNPSARPRIGGEISRGAEGIVYENLDQPDWVVKVFHPGRTSPLQAANEFANLEKARAIRPNNVVKAEVPKDPRQGWIVKERMFRDMPMPSDLLVGKQVEQDFIDGGVQEVAGNLFFGHTADNLMPRWLLIE